MHTKPLLPRKMGVRGRLLSALAAAALLAGCALNGDFGRVRPELVYDDMHDWVGRDAVRGVGGKPSQFRLTDDERQLRDFGYALIQPPYDRTHWDSVFANYGWEGPRPNAPFDRTAYWNNLDVAHRRSEASSYAQIVTDARNDAVRIEPFFAVAALVVDADQRRAQALGYVARSTGLTDVEANNALSRNNENTAVIEWVCRSLKQRAASYRYALERMIIVAPSPNAAEGDRSLALLESRIGIYCGPTRVTPAHPLVTKG
ncbi:MAG TPA: hypothetical protein VKW08_12740 [Xanthobacteraceae bacterium]|nr:hypothetical protein [Xanthobacteraceae bacterium]